MTSKHPFVDRMNPEAWGVCDRCLQTVLYKTMRREMVQTGDSLTWNGLLICARPRCMDKPHPQSRTRKAIVDPIPIRDSRAGDNPLTPTQVSSWVAKLTEAGNTAVPLHAVTGFQAGDSVRIIPDNNQKFQTTISTIVGLTLNLVLPLPFRASIGAMVIDLTRS